MSLKKTWSGLGKVFYTGPHSNTSFVFAQDHIYVWFLIFACNWSENFCCCIAMLDSVEPPEINEKPIDHKSKVKLNIMSLKMKQTMYQNWQFMIGRTNGGMECRNENGIYIKQINVPLKGRNHRTLKLLFSSFSLILSIVYTLYRETTTTRYNYNLTYCYLTHSLQHLPTDLINKNDFLT